MKKSADFFELKKYMVIVGRKEKRHVPFHEAFQNVINGWRG